MSGIQRYSPSEHLADGCLIATEPCRMVEDKAGRYVRYEDYERQLSAALQHKHQASPTELYARLHRIGLGNWIGKSTTTPNDLLNIAQACVDALDQFDTYERLLDVERRALKSCRETERQVAASRDAALEDVARLESVLRGIASCATCGVCQAAAMHAIGGAT